jgi:hypothetical protein
MSITTYGELKTAIANWLDDDNLTSRIPEFISLCEDRIAQNLRIRLMETSADLTVNAQEVSLPTGYLGHRRLYLSGNPVRMLNYETPDNFWQSYMSTDTAKPVAFTVEGDNFVFGPAPDTTYTGKILYYKRLTAFSDDADTNTLLTTARGLYLYGSLIEAATYLEDDVSILKWSALFDDLIDKVMTNDKRDRASGVIRMRDPAVGVV